MGGSFKTDTPQLQEYVISEDQGLAGGQIKTSNAAAENGYNICVLASCDGGMGGESGNVHAGGMLGENGHSVYYSPGYNYSHQSAYCTYPGPCMGTRATGYRGAQYMPNNQQLSPAMMQDYSPPKQEVSKSNMEKPTSREAGQFVKSKRGVQQPKSGYELGCKTSVPSEVPNHWGVYLGPTNGGFNGSTAAYEYYTQQWHSTQQGFQPLCIPQNMGGHAPSTHGGGPGLYQAFPWVHSSAITSGRFLKGSFTNGGSPAQNWWAKEAIMRKGDGVQHDQAQRPAMAKPKVVSFSQEGDPIGMVGNNTTRSISRNDYNKEDFPTSYETAKFFVIKSYSEDDVHKSIKYSVWSSTPNGNKRLDEAYRTAQESPSPSEPCRVFFFFSVNCSGQFCGVAEMVGHVDFNKNMDFWLQGKWNGCLPLKWHIIKDVPHGHFRHIILSNNENKPVTNSRDTQEVHFHQGLEMLKIFKYFPVRTSLLDDFAFYDGRQRVLKERRLRQQVVRQQSKEKALEKVSYMVLDSAKENGRPVKQADTTSIGADVISNQLQKNENVEPDEGENGKTEGERSQVEDFMSVADFKAKEESDVKALEVNQACNCGPERVSEVVEVASASKSRGDDDGTCEILSMVEKASKMSEELASKSRVDSSGACERLSIVEKASKPASKSRGDNGETGERVSKVEKAASKVSKEAATPKSKGDNGETGERVSKVEKAASKVSEEATMPKCRGDNGGMGGRISKVGKETAFKYRGDNCGTGERISQGAKAASKAGEEMAPKLRGGNGGTCKNMCSNNRLAEIRFLTTGSNKSSIGHKGSSSSGGIETSNHKDDVSRMVINYKKALLEGIPDKVIVLDQTIGS